MSNESTMKSFDIPVAAEMTSDQAEVSLKKIHADAVCNESHPYTNPNHVQHRDFVVAVTELHKVKAGEALSNPIEQACNDALTEQADAKLAVATKTAGVVKQLDAKGFDDAPGLTVNTPVWKQDIWKMQLSRSNGNHELLKNDLQSHVVKAKLDGLKIPIEIQDKLSAYAMSPSQTEKDKVIQDDLSQAVLEFLGDEHGKQDRAIDSALSGDRKHGSRFGSNNY